MNNVVLDCREIEKLCRQRAISDRARSWKWLGAADRWNNLAHREIASRFKTSRFKTSRCTPVQWQWGQTPLGATRTDRSRNRYSACNL